MRDTGSRDHSQEAGRGHPAAHVLYADGEMTSTGIIQAALRQLDVKVTHCDDLENCFGFLRTREYHLLLSNTKRPAVEGVELLLSVKRIAPSVPVILLVDHGDIQAAVHAMKVGAFDCLERPPEKGQLVSAIDVALREPAQNSLPQKPPLSKAEERILRLILQGHTTAEMALRLHRSRRTIEVHRSHIMRKLQANGMVDLVRKSAHLGFLKNWP